MTENRKDSLLRAAMKGVRLYGLDGVRIQHIAKLAGGAASNIYGYYTGKEELMQACFERVDREIAHLFDSVQVDPERVATDPAGEVRRLWTPYWRWLVAHPDETVFYHRYRDSMRFPEYDKVRDVSYFASFSASVMTFQAVHQIFSRVPPDLLWLYVLTGTVMYAKYVVEGVLPDTPATEECIFQLMMHGLDPLLPQQDRSAEKTGSRPEEA